MRIQAIGIVALLGLAACGSAPTGPLPSGTYHYESHENNVSLTSTITVTRTADAIDVNEVARFGNLNSTTTIDTRLDPKTLSAIGYSVQGGPEGPQPSITLRPSGATYEMAGAPTIVKPAPQAGAPSWVFAEEWASTFVAVPALVHATGATSFNAYYPVVLHGKVLAQVLMLVDVTNPRPDGVPASDASLGLAFRRTEQPLITLWYDPNTYVVDVVQGGTDTQYTRTP